MTDDIAPFEPDELDELLSAELDGELDAAARDFGLSSDVVEARLRATPGVETRRHALAAAHEALSQPPAIDELIEARLRAKAVRAADHAATEHANAKRERVRNVLQVVGGVAAAAVLVAGVTFALHQHGSSSKSATSAPELSRGTARIPAPGVTPSAYLGAFADDHAVANAAVLRTRVLAEEAPSTVATPAAANNAAHPDTTNALSKSSVSKSSGDFAGNASPPVAGCTVPASIPHQGKQVLRAPATLAGQPVVVFVFVGSGTHAGEQTIVIEDRNCRLRYEQTTR